MVPRGDTVGVEKISKHLTLSLSLILSSFWPKKILKILQNMYIFKKCKKKSFFKKGSKKILSQEFRSVIAAFWFKFTPNYNKKAAERMVHS